MFLLDTNVVSEAIRPEPDPNVTRWLASQPPARMFLSAIVKAELFSGVEQMPSGKRRDTLAQSLNGFFGLIDAQNCIGFGFEESEHYARIYAKRKRMGAPIDEMDALIAASASVRGLGLATRNIKDFENCGIALINPWEFAA
jgi:predicted nucleic acid-binding protein